MKTNVAAMTALASSLLLTVAVAANAAPSLNLKSSLGTASGLVDLARSGGGGGGGGGHGGGMKAGGGGGHGGMSNRGGGGHSGRMAGRGYSKGDFSGRSGGNFKSGRGPGRGYAGKNWNGGKNWDHGNNRHGGSKYRYGKNYRRFYGSDIFVYGGTGGYYDCNWLWRQAQVTGSPYWWQRYQECLY